MSTQREIPRYPIGDPPSHPERLHGHPQLLQPLPAVDGESLNLLSLALKSQQEEITALKLKVANQALQLKMLHLAVARRNARSKHHLARYDTLAAAAESVYADHIAKVEDNTHMALLWQALHPARPTRVSP